MKAGHCGRCGHQLQGELCGFCLAEVLGIRLTSHLPVTSDPDLLGPFMRALFVEHFSLRRSLVARPY